jgi:hypothetical protein
MATLIIPQGTGQLVYCATPSRLSHLAEDISQYTHEKGYAPLQPLTALPRQHFEDNPQVGREKTMGYCLEIVDWCKEFWLFGISKGTVREFLSAIDSRKPIRLITGFDSEWESKAVELNVADMLRRFPLYPK